MSEEKILARYQRSLSFLPRAAETADLTFLYDNSDALMLLGYFTEGVWHPVVLPVHAYVDQAFVQPMEARQAERRRMAVYGGNGGLELPNEEDGQYIGTVVAAGVHYLVQEVAEGDLTTRYRHDALWLSESPQPEWTGKTAVIHYGQTSSGLATVSFS